MIDKVYHNHVKSIFQVDFFKVIKSAAALCYIKNHLEISLNEAKEKYPDKNYEGQEKIIALFKKHIDVIYEVDRDNSFLVKEIMKINNIASALQHDNFLLRAEAALLNDKLKKCREEIGLLKEV